MRVHAGNNLAAPCGLYCGACIDYLIYETCHSCGCECGKCAASDHHKRCEIYRCCAGHEDHESCKDCRDLPCSKLIQFCYNPVWLHHLPIIENLRRQKALGIGKWLKEQEEVWINDWHLQRWLWLQKTCEGRLKESESPLPKKARVKKLTRKTRFPTNQRHKSQTRNES
jgi:hypothetical protein